MIKLLTVSLLIPFGQLILLQEQFYSWDNLNSLQYHVRSETTYPVLQASQHRSSETQEVIEQMLTSEVGLMQDTIKNFTSERAFLSFEAKDSVIHQGQCTILTLAFNVRDDNQLKLAFFELGSQYAKLYLSEFKIPNTFIVDNHIGDVVGVEKLLNGRKFTTYKIYEAAYCSYENGDIVIPPVKLMMQLLNDNNENYNIVEFFTTASKVAVRPIPSNDITQYHRYKMVGDFKLNEWISENQVSVNDPVIYKVEISGEGLAFPIEPLRINNPEVRMDVVDIQSSDTIINQTLHTKRTFIYQIIPKKISNVDLGEFFYFKFYNPVSEKQEIIRSTKRIVVSGDTKISPPDSITLNRWEHLIVIDGSRSMMIEDYPPYRLQVVKEGVRDFYQGLTNCRVGVIVFAGEAKVVRSDKRNGCYFPETIDSITFLSKRGTAIGDAIWRAVMEIDPEGFGQRKIIIIGDGDDTGSIINPKYAVELAKKRNINISAIGIGSHGPVPLGKDSQGKSVLYDNTFSDKDFRLLSHLTDGKYYHAKNAEEVTLYLKEILNE